MDNLVVLTDFDGTLAREDVGYLILTKFARPGWRETLALWKKGLIGSGECHLRNYTDMSTTGEELLSQVIQAEIDPCFPEFYQYLKEKDIPISIVSDGFDLYIEPILQKYQLNKIDLYSNKMVYNEISRKYEMNFPGKHPTCYKCANCKARVVQGFLNKGKRVIYIGDSYSDYYAASISDLTFAKKRLKEYCKKEEKKFIPYQGFGDILRYFKENQPSTNKCSYDELHIHQISPPNIFDYNEIMPNSCTSRFNM